MQGWEKSFAMKCFIFVASFIKGMTGMLRYNSNSSLRELFQPLETMNMSTKYNRHIFELETVEANKLLVPAVKVALKAPP